MCMVNKKAFSLKGQLYVKYRLLDIFVVILQETHFSLDLALCKSLRSRKPFVLAKPSNFRMHWRHHCLLIAINKKNHEAN